MPTSTYFRNFDARNDQELLHSLTTESIQVVGYDVNYIPRTLVNEENSYKAEFENLSKTPGFLETPPVFLRKNEKKHISHEINACDHEHQQEYYLQICLNLMINRVR